MAVNYLPADTLFDIDFYGEFCHSIWETNLVFEKFFKIAYKPEGDFPNGEYEFVQTLELSEFGEKILTIGGIGIATLVILFLGVGIAILINQRKIKRQLQELLNQKDTAPDDCTT